MKSEIEEQLRKAEERIVAGEIRQAGFILQKIKPTSLPRSQIARMAQLLRRVGCYDQALRILMPFVRPKAALLTPASSQEKAEYAICLQRAGSLDEARDLLEGIPEAEVREVLLYKAIFRFPDWEYAEAVSSLEKLIGLTTPGEYLHHVARLNLAAAYVTLERYSEAEEVLRDLRSATLDQGLLLLHGNALEVSAQSAVFQGDLETATKCLEGAKNVLSGVKTFERLWLIKWECIVSAIKSQDPELLVPAYEEARRKSHWETLRELDFFSCKIKYDEALARKLYYGSASSRYRQRLLKHLQVPEGSAIFLGKDFSYAGTASESVHVLHGFQGALSAGDLPHLALLMLLSDAYRGLRSGQLHSKLFPGDYFNASTSLDRVHQVMKRVRQQLEEQLPGAKLEQVDGVYRLDLSGLERTIEMVAEMPPLEGARVKLEALRLKIGRVEFDSADVQTAFELSRAAANRLIAQWRDLDLVDAEGAARHRSYRIRQRLSVQADARLRRVA